MKKNRSSKLESMRYHHGFTKFILLLTVAVLTSAAGFSAELPNLATNSLESSPCFSQLKELGIEIIALRRSAANYMLDLRFKVIDPEKAKKFLARETQLFLIHQNTGSKFIVPTTPKVGDLRQTSRQPIAGRVYFVLFSNPGTLAKHGDVMNLVDGNQKLADLIVE